MYFLLAEISGNGRKVFETFGFYDSVEEAEAEVEEFLHFLNAGTDLEPVSVRTVTVCKQEAVIKVSGTPLADRVQERISEEYTASCLEQKRQQLERLKQELGE
jgi:hypothetical protein